MIMCSKFVLINHAVLHSHISAIYSLVGKPRTIISAHWTALLQLQSEISPSTRTLLTTTNCMRAGWIRYRDTQIIMLFYLNVLAYRDLNCTDLPGLLPVTRRQFASCAKRFYCFMITIEWQSSNLHHVST